MPSIVKSLRVLADPDTAPAAAAAPATRNSPSPRFRKSSAWASRGSRAISPSSSRRQLVRDRRAGKNIYYALAADHPLQAQLAEIVPRQRAGDSRSRSTIKPRSQLALAQAPGQGARLFQPARGQIRPQPLPGPLLAGGSRTCCSRSSPPIVVADLGAGEGTLSQLLARHAKKVIADR